MARIRVPGGVLTAAQLRVLASCAERLGDGVVHLTARANVQLRGLDSDTATLANWLADAGLLPAPSHELVRNILASPASGRIGGRCDVRELVTELDAAICATAELASLPGRFLFAFDDGRGDICGLGADACWLALAPHWGALVLDGVDSGLRVSREHAAEALLLVARTFTRVRGDDESAPWRIGEHDDAARVIVDAVRSTFGDAADERVPMVPVSTGLGEVGVHAQDDGAALCHVASRFGSFSAAQAHLLAAWSDVLVLTPGRDVLVTDLPRPHAERCADELARAGFVLDPADPALGISACIGLPGCARSNADVRADAEHALAALSPGVAAHVAGCERRCGRPRGWHQDVVAQQDGYRVDGTWVPTAQLADSLLGKDKQ